jgi:uncharacterized protein (DUF58 family)
MTDPQPSPRTRLMVPTPRFVRLCALAALLSIFMLIDWSLRWVVGAFDVALAIAMIAEVQWLLRKPRIRVSREHAANFAIGRSYPVSLKLQLSAPCPVEVTVMDMVPSDATAEALPATLNLRPGRTRWLDYQLTISRRGDHQLDGVHVLVTGRWGLWRRQLVLPLPGRIVVYPDLRRASEYMRLARRSVNSTGSRRQPRIGGDNEFARLKEYHHDDEFRHIAWKATARQDRLIAKAFQMNENQSVVLMLDCGRMMQARSGDTPLMDHALNATLMLSQIALSHQDRVGILTFAGRVQAYLPPRAGRAQSQRILRTTYACEADPGASDYGGAMAFLEQRCRRRTLVILIGHVIDDHTFDALLRHLSVQARRHLPLLILLRDREVEDLYAESATAREDENPEAVYTRAAVAEFLTWRRQRIESLKSRGILCLDVFPENLTAGLVNEYLRIKAQHLL